MNMNYDAASSGIHEGIPVRRADVRGPHAGKQFDVLIIGGGASGLLAACALSRNGRRIVILEKQSRVGRKLLSTGNGRCNFTNLNASAKDYHGSRQAVQQALKFWPPRRVMEFFESIGIPGTADEEGRVYPLSGQAASLLDALRLYADEQGVETLTEFAVDKLTRSKWGFTAKASDGRTVQANYAILCTGGLAAPKLGACGDGYKILEELGHRITPKFPAIAALKTPPEPVRGLKGIRASAEISLVSGNDILRTERGEVLFAESGVSGIAAMQLARSFGEAQRAGKKCAVRINFLPEAANAFSLLKERRNLLPKRSMEDFLNGIVQKRLGQTLVKAAGIEPLSRTADSLTKAEIGALADILSGWTIPVTGVQGFDQAQVTAGGADMKDFDVRSMQSLEVPGLFAAGEVLDVDGDCGGFNLQWAWSSALTACDCIEQMLNERG